MAKSGLIQMDSLGILIVWCPFKLIIFKYLFNNDLAWVMNTVYF